MSQSYQGDDVLIALGPVRERMDGDAGSMRTHYFLRTLDEQGRCDAYKWTGKPARFAVVAERVDSGDAPKTWDRAPYTFGETEAEAITEYLGDSDFTNAEAVHVRYVWALRAFKVAQGRLRAIEALERYLSDAHASEVIRTAEAEFERVCRKRRVWITSNLTPARQAVADALKAEAKAKWSPVVTRLLAADKAVAAKIEELRS